MKLQTTANQDDKTEDQELIRRVDAMMDPSYQVDAVKEANDQINKPAEEETAKDVVDAASANPDLKQEPIDIFADVATAPLLSGHKNLNSSPKPSSHLTKIKVIKADNESDSEIPVEIEPDDSVDLAPVESTEDQELPNKPIEYDDKELDTAIAEIVSHESDEALLVEDSVLKRKQAEIQVPKQKRFKHPIFWSLVGLVSLVAIAMIVFLVDPNIHDPIPSINWSRLEHQI